MISRLVSHGVRLTFLSLLASLPASAHPGSGIVVDRAGRVFFTDAGGGGSLWRVDPKGPPVLVQQGRLQGLHWLALDEAGRYSAATLEAAFRQRVAPNVGRVSLSGSGALSLQTDGCPIAVDGGGSLWFAKGHLEIARLAPDGAVTLAAPKLKPIADELGGIKGLAAGPDGALYAATPVAVLRITRDGAVTVTRVTLPGVANPSLRGLAVDAQGVVYAAATDAGRVVRVAADGTVETVLTAEPPWSPTGVAWHGGDVYVLEYTGANGEDQSQWRPRVRVLHRDGRVRTVAP